MPKNNRNGPSALHHLYSLMVFILLTFGPTKSEAAEGDATLEKTKFSIVETYFSRFLAQGTTLSILHTSNNRLWVSNYEGVFKARGKSIKHHNELFANAAGFSQIRIRAMTEIWDRKVIAVSDSNDILLYEESLGYFVEPQWLDAFGFENGLVSEVYFSRKGILWVGFTGGDVVQVREDGGIERDNRIIFDGGVTDFHEDTRNNNFLIAGKDKIFRINLETDDLEIFDIADKCDTSSPVQEVASVPTGDIWVGTFGGGLYSLDAQTNACRQVDSGIKTEKDFHRSTIHDLTIDENTGASIVSTDQGIFVFRADSAVQNFTTSNSKLSNNEVISISSDQAGGFWVGTYHGINRLVISPFELFDQQMHEGLHSVVGFDALGNDRILVASYGGLLSTDMGSTGFSRFQDDFPDIALYGERVMAAFVNLNKIYVGYRNYGFEVLDVHKSVASRWNTVSLDTLASNSISAFLNLDGDQMLIGTYGGGLTIYGDPELSRNIQSGTASNSLRDDRILMLHRSSEGTIWVGTESGLQVFDLNTGHFRSAIFAGDAWENADQPLIWSMVESTDYVWFGSLHHGLFRFNKSTYAHDFSVGALERVPTNDVLSSMTVYAMETGSENEVWFSTNQGIARLGNDGSFVNFGHTYGLQETEFELGSSFKDNNGLIYFGGNHGYNRFNPETVNSLENASEIVLNNIVLDSRGSKSYLNTSSLESILLSHKDLFITFEFSALDYTDPESTRYRHKLVGFDTDWVDIGSRGSATYTSLPAGDYVFRVQAVNSAGIWNYDGLAIGLQVKPPPWLTWWAFSAYLIAAIGILSWAWRFQRNNMLRDQELKHANEMQRIADRIADDLQDQIDFQSKLNDSMHHYNKQLLYWTKFCTDTTVDYETADKLLAHDRIRFRLDVLELLQDSLYYRGEQLYAQLHSFVTLLVNKLCSDHPQVCSRLTSVNDVQRELVPAARALPIAIILAELFDNSLRHAFSDQSAPCFVRFSLTVTPNMSSNSDTFRLAYQDDGDGIPMGLSFESPESAGFAIMRHAAETLGCELEIADHDRTVVTASFDLAWS